jgi:D-ribulokinase
LLENNCSKIGSSILDIGKPLGKGLTESAANDLGLLPGISVGVGLIDAHSGGLGTVRFEF